jgi:hypothetical protein
MTEEELALFLSLRDRIECLEMDIVHIRDNDLGVVRHCLCEIERIEILMDEFRGEIDK